MSSVKVSATFDVPPRFLIYDLSEESFFCMGCTKATRFQIVGRPRLRDGSPSVEKRFQDFVNEHAKCVAAVQSR